MLHHHLYFCINFVFIYFVFMFCKILTWLVTILLQDIVAPYGNTCMKNMVIFFSCGKLAYKRVYGLCPIYKHSKHWTFAKALKNRCISFK